MTGRFPATKSTFSCKAATGADRVIRTLRLGRVLLTDFTDRLYVMEGGEIIFAGMSRQARKDAAVARVIEGDRRRGWLIETAGPPVIDV